MIGYRRVKDNSQAAGFGDWERDCTEPWKERRQIQGKKTMHQSVGCINYKEDLDKRGKWKYGLEERLGENVEM